MLPGFYAISDQAGIYIFHILSHLNKIFSAVINAFDLIICQSLMETVSALTLLKRICFNETSAVKQKYLQYISCLNSQSCKGNESRGKEFIHLPGL